MNCNLRQHEKYVFSSKPIVPLYSPIHSRIKCSVHIRNDDGDSPNPVNGQNSERRMISGVFDMPNEEE